MIQVAFVKPNGEISHIMSPGSDSDYIEGGEYGDCVARHIEYDIDPASFLALQVWSDDDWLSRDPQPTPQHAWIDGAWELDQTALEAAVRRERDSLLFQSDWTQLADSPADKTAWAAYRQLLRDMPESITDWLDIVWPIAPVD